VEISMTQPVVGAFGGREAEARRGKKAKRGREKRKAGF